MQWWPSIGLTGCTEDPPIIADTDDIGQFAKSILDDPLPCAIAEVREFYVYIFQTAHGDLGATAALPGRESYYDLPDPTGSTIASYRTRGGFSEDYHDEVPSLDHVEWSFDTDIGGYIGGPGAHLARQLFGPTRTATLL